MKNLVFFALMTGILISACKKTDEPCPACPPEPGWNTFVVNGVVFDDCVQQPAGGEKVYFSLIVDAGDPMNDDRLDSAFAANDGSYSFTYDYFVDPAQPEAAVILEFPDAGIQIDLIEPGNVESYEFVLNDQVQLSVSLAVSDPMTESDTLFYSLSTDFFLRKKAGPFSNGNIATIELSKRDLDHKITGSSFTLQWGFSLPELVEAQNASSHSRKRTIPYPACTETALGLINW